MINSIMDTRERHEDGHYHIFLKIPRDEFERAYDGNYSNENAADFLTYYLEMRGDDGKPKNIIIKRSEKQDLVEIQADLEYYNNEHTDYNKQLGSFFINSMEPREEVNSLNKFNEHK